MCVTCRTAGRCGCFDDSGGHSESPVIPIGGIICAAGTWAEFGKAWKRALPKGIAGFKPTDLEFGAKCSPLSKLPKPEKAEPKRNVIAVLTSFRIEVAG